ncbi:AMP-binding enzyme family protein [Mycolicibacterium hassiacum DSM 44199]|uniref:Long-chain-fatty-acid--CoA ligase FadD13 n=1 Tax=Mycolicibacterium hassiacum (strain DSM 44199 / CIP 105218 / JCM 12690 / 3849) TaxID=1122247 RepID=K5BDV9_MYCHD|nr:AMP-binding protein [Mycolicibacterium hassiacum]EKF22497.1 AMP-binding enzyme family protein [Mycolicibacterium hassiacum DSM 44199]MDA4084897.1 AMP-dependent synthetase and ligase [Mycolicibacterium hassiacum DSM 44199]VCT91725.1 Short-chain-fatty-acid--CoA ligase [Mycolicibacterium hassiacum DSM 44199]
MRVDESRAAEAYRNGHWVRHTLADALRDAARSSPDRILVVDGDVRLSCADLHAQATALARALTDRMPAGSVVSFMLPNWHEAAVIYLGATLAGMVVNPILPSLRDRELAFILSDADVRAIFIPAAFNNFDYVGMLDRVTAAMSGPPEVVVLRGDAGGHTPYQALLGAGGSAGLPVLEPDSVRMILYTSGTTGRPKGVLHTHNSIHALIRQLGEHWMIAAGDRFLVPSPIAHIGGSIYAFECPLLLGTTAVLMDRWEPDRAVSLMTTERITHMAGATPFLDGLLAAAERAGTRLPDLKVFICGGASVPPSLIRRASAYFEKAAVSRVYGSTEVPVTTVGALGDVDHAADTDGRPGLAEVRLVDGEIRARGPQMLAGYLHPEDETAAFDDEGFFRTGDLARWVDGDYLVVTGRAKDIIIRNGENISPKEIEDILIGHPNIAEIAVVGVPDERTGERACAVIVPADGAAPGLPELRDMLIGAGVAKFKIPEQVVVWDGLPKNDAGKVLKHQIRARLTKEHQT